MQGHVKPTGRATFPRVWPISKKNCQQTSIKRAGKKIHPPDLSCRPWVRLDLFLTVYSLIKFQGSVHFQLKRTLASSRKKPFWHTMFSVFFCAEAFGGKHFHARLPWCSFSDGDFYGIKSSWASRRVQKMQQERVQQKNRCISCKMESWKWTCQMGWKSRKILSASVSKIYVANNPEDGHLQTMCLVLETHRQLVQNNVWPKYYGGLTPGPFRDSYRRFLSKMGNPFDRIPKDKTKELIQHVLRCIWVYIQNWSSGCMNGAACRCSESGGKRDEETCGVVGLKLALQES